MRFFLLFLSWICHWFILFSIFFFFLPACVVRTVCITKWENTAKIIVPPGTRKRRLLTPSKYCVDATRHDSTSRGDTKLLAQSTRFFWGGGVHFSFLSLFLYVIFYQQHEIPSSDHRPYTADRRRKRRCGERQGKARSDTYNTSIQVKNNKTHTYIIYILYMYTSARVYMSIYVSVYVCMYTYIPYCIYTSMSS